MFRPFPPMSLVGLSALSLAAMTACNQAPTEPDVTIEPAEPTTIDDLTARLATEATDGNDDPLTYAYQWEVSTVEGSWTEVEGLTGATVPSSYTEKGQTWRVRVTVSDGVETATFTMEEADTGPVTVVNSLPEITSVRMSPTSGVDTFGVLTASASATDIDGDDVEIRYTWYVNGTAVELGPNASPTTLPGDYFAKGDEVWVEAVALDGQDTGEPVASSRTTIINTPPRIDGVVITPDEIVESTEVMCEPIGWYDADDDAPNVYATWMVNGVEVEGVTGALTGEYFTRGDVIRCMGAPDDGDSRGDIVVSEPAVVGNTAPSVGTVTIDNTSPQATDVLTVTMTDVVDVDGDEVMTRVDWYVDGELVHTGAELPARSFVKGQAIYAVVTPSDDVVEGEPVESAAVTAVNSPPVLTAVNLTPGDLYTDSEAFPNVEIDDPDGDTISYTLTWKVNGTAVSETGSVLNGETWFNKGDTVEVEVTPNDGTVDGSPMSSSVVTVLNTPPSTPVLAMDPEKPKSDDDLWCYRTLESSDPDPEDTLERTLTWTRNGSPFTSTDTLDLTGDYVDATYTADKDRWTCTLEVTDGTDTATATLTVDVLDWAGPREFTNCGKTGYTGPSQSQCTSSYSGTALDSAVTVVDGGWQEWVVPQDGTFRIEAWGAEGGTGRFGSYGGGRGARMRGDFELSEGDKLLVLVGQEGQSDAGSYAAGGGGASAVLMSDGTPLIVAAGGGGNGYAYYYQSSCGGRTTGYPGNGSGSFSGGCGTSYRSSGYGGSYYYRYTGSRYYYGGGGAGYRGDGTDYVSVAYSNAEALNDSSAPARGANGRYGDGGFGGGGAGGYAYRYSWSSYTYYSSSYGSGGGGGYTGGNGGYYRAGGGAGYNDGSNTSNTAYNNQGPGAVTIDLAP